MCPTRHSSHVTCLDGQVTDTLLVLARYVAEDYVENCPRCDDIKTSVDRVIISALCVFQDAVFPITAVQV